MREVRNYSSYKLSIQMIYNFTMQWPWLLLHHLHYWFKMDSIRKNMMNIWMLWIFSDWSFQLNQLLKPMTNTINMNELMTKKKLKDLIMQMLCLRFNYCIQWNREVCLSRWNEIIVWMQLKISSLEIHPECLSRTFNFI